jgi:hypothetical protein
MDTMKKLTTILIICMSLILSQAFSIQEKSVVENQQVLLVREKGTQRKIYLKSDRVTYMEAGKVRWTIHQFKKSFKFNDASFLPDRILVSVFSDQEKIIELAAHHTQTGRRIWGFQAIQVCGQALIQISGFKQYVIFQSHCFEGQFNTFVHIIRTASGIEIAKGINTEMIAVVNNQLLLSYGKYIPVGRYLPKIFRPRLGVPLSTERFWAFTNVARAACEPLSVTGNQWAAGEYIYSANRDGCGTYTLRFHWTDQRHPKPEVIAGWPLSGPQGKVVPESRIQDQTIYLWRGQWGGGPQPCPLLPQVADCPGPEQRVRPTRY